MNLVAAGLLVAAVAGLAAAVVGAAARPPARTRLAGLLGGAASAGGLLAGAAALGGQRWAVTLHDVAPTGAIVLAVDPLSGLFLLLVSGVALVCAVYGIGYCTPRAPAGEDGEDGEARGPGSRTAQGSLPVFVVAMQLVPAAGSATTLLVLWELMALASLVLVLAEHRARPEVREAGLWYALMTHAGFVALLVGLLVFAGAAGDDAFTALRQAGDQLSPGTRSLVFLLVLVGFGSKAGMVPVHVWLPRAHPEAPSHVSALMSAAMVALGLYGLLRVWFDLLGGGPAWWGVLVLVLGAASALYGVLQASVATDLKRLLGYSTTENVGLMLIGVGAAGVFAAEGNRTLAGLLVAAALLHAVNHAGFKALLFLGAGSVLRATGLRDLDRLGGLAARMPVTTALTAVGALCAAALPPGNGFVSEWLLLQGLIHSIMGTATTSVVVAVTMPLAVAVVALTAGLGAVTFVKAFAVGLLARPRSQQAADAVESPWTMRAGMMLAAAACVALALAPTAVSGPLTRVVQVLEPVQGSAALVKDPVALRLAGIAGSMSPLLIAVGLLVGVLVVVVAARAVARGRIPRRTGLLWGCGGTRLDPRMEYTATAFAEPLVRVFDDVLRPEQDLDVTSYAESRYLIESVRFSQDVPDRLEARLYRPLFTAAQWWGQRSRAAANGSVHRYLGYGFAGLLVVLVMVGVTG